MEGIKCSKKYGGQTVLASVEKNYHSEGIIAAAMRNFPLIRLSQNMQGVRVEVTPAVINIYFDGLHQFTTNVPPTTRIN